MAKLALVTGASRGIGAAIAETLARAGLNVAVHCRANRAGAEETVRRCRELGVQAQAFFCDVSDSAQVDHLRSEIHSAMGDPLVLVNNAGVDAFGLLTDTTDEEWRRVMGTDLDGVFYCCRAFIPAMVHQKWGRILNIASMWGIAGASCEAVYSAAKAGVIGLTKALARELGPSGITVNAVAPGVIRTDMNARHSAETMDQLREETPLCRLGEPEDVAAAAAFLASEQAGFITGQVLGTDGGYL
ncbi:MAG TPA: 3-oxoacyl-ACP reductase FabG [Candidatus Onthovicinus excrementipullorum]|nr:3-oxoacyl-ACP reductase FabG [Candidatus Onthovicinus excrementipullorum]